MLLLVKFVFLDIFSCQCMILHKNVMKLFYVFSVPVKIVILSAEQDQTAIVIVVILNGLNGVIAL